MEFDFPLLKEISSGVAFVLTFVLFEEPQIFPTDWLMSLKAMLNEAMIWILR